MISARLHHPLEVTNRVDQGAVRSYNELACCVIAALAASPFGQGLRGAMLPSLLTLMKAELSNVHAV
jgi:hypothetical protein